MLIYVGDRCENRGKYGNLGISSLQISLTPKLYKNNPTIPPYTLYSGIFYRKLYTLYHGTEGVIMMATILTHCTPLHSVCHSPPLLLRRIDLVPRSRHHLGLRLHT